MSRFEVAYAQALTEDYKLNPSDYIHSLDRAIEIEMDNVKRGLSRKDSRPMLRACELLGIGNSYKEIKDEL